MKAKWRGLPLMTAALLLALALFPVRALAADAALYPSEVRESENGGIYRIEKVYCLTTQDDPAAIPAGDFQREGRTYTLLDILKNGQTETDTKDHIEVITLDSDTNDMGKIIQQLEPTLEVATEDGYTGVLTPDYPTISVEAAGYQTRTRTVTASRTYPNLSDADTALIPKTIQDGGRTLTLSDVQWREENGFYTAAAVYSGTAAGKYATGYTVTVDYKGQVSKESSDQVIYTAVFESQDEISFLPEPEEPAQDESGGLHSALLLAPLAVLPAGLGFGCWKLIRYRRDKKRGYVK